MIYVAAPYSNMKDVDAHMDKVARLMGEYMQTHAGTHLISPLQHHWTLKQVPHMGTTYVYWRDFSRNLLKRCDRVIVFMFEGWQQSGGVLDEISFAEELGLEIEYIEVND